MELLEDCNCFALEDLPTVQHLIRSADRDLLAYEVSGLSDFDGTLIEGFAAHAALDEMMLLETRKPSKKWVFLPYEYYALGNMRGTIDRRIDAALVRRQDFEVIELLSSQEEFFFSAEDCRKCLQRENERFGVRYPDLHAWTLRPWEKTLSFRVSMRGGYCRKERYQMLAAIVCDMLAFGRTACEARAKQKIVKARIRQRPKLAREKRGKSNWTEGPAETFDRDYEGAYRQRLQDTALVLNHNVAVDLHRRVADLAKWS